MIARLMTIPDVPPGVCVPDGFELTPQAYQEFLRTTSLRPLIARQLQRYHHGADLLAVGAAIRTAFAYAEMPVGLARRITAAYRSLGGDGTAVVVRSEGEIFHNLRTSRDLLAACKRCFAVPFSDQAVANGRIDHLSATVSVAVQRMVRSDLAGSGTAASLGSPGHIRITAIWGLGDAIVGGHVDPDEYFVLDASVVARRRGTKATKVVCAEAGGVRAVPTSPGEGRRDVLDESEIRTIARWVGTVDKYYGRSMTIEWAKDGPSGDLYVVHALPAPTQVLVEDESRTPVGAAR
jgi:pyruvate, water dikinase